MVKFLMVLRVALNALTINKLRSTLTMLGIVIGVASVIALVAAGEGSQQEVISRFQQLGSNLLTVSAGGGGGFTFSARGAQQNTRALTNADVAAIKGLVTGISNIAPDYNGSGTVTYMGNSTSATLVGVTPEYAEAQNWQVAQGRFISQEDNDNLALVVLLGRTVVETLFENSAVNPVGQTVRINRQNYTIVGILESKGQSGGFGQDNQILMPLRTAQLKLGGAGNQDLRNIYVQVESAEQMDFVQAQITAVLRTLHGLQSTESDDFTVQNQADILESVEETTGTFTVLLGSIAAISLLVGGIGVMNIMLVSVTERTREVGLRKAVGAKRMDILVQFLIEAIILSILGGLLGVGLGVSGAQAIAGLIGEASAVITADSIGMALGVSLGIGIFFGLYPANRAARLNPIDALRYE